MKLSPNVFWPLVVALIVCEGLALKFLGSNASSVSVMVATVFAALMKLHPSDTSPPEPLIAKEEAEVKKPDLKVIAGGLLLLIAIGFGGPLACAYLPTPQDGADIADHVNALDKCEAEAKAVKSAKCGDAASCPEGYAAYDACKKDGGF